jgi:hypothetical protein
MTKPSPLQKYHSRADLIWQDGPFKDFLKKVTGCCLVFAPVLYANTSFTATMTHKACIGTIPYEKRSQFAHWCIVLCNTQHQTAPIPLKLCIL